MVYRCEECGRGMCEACAILYSFRYRSYLHFRMWQRPSYRALYPHWDGIESVRTVPHGTPLRKERR
jgi:hypothetical protein